MRCKTSDKGKTGDQTQRGSDESCQRSTGSSETRFGNCTTVESSERSGSRRETAGYRSEENEGCHNSDGDGERVPATALTANTATPQEMLNRFWEPSRTKRRRQSRGSMRTSKETNHARQPIMPQGFKPTQHDPASSMRTKGSQPWTPRRWRRKPSRKPRDEQKSEVRPADRTSGQTGESSTRPCKTRFQKQYRTSQAILALMLL